MFRKHLALLALALTAALVLSACSGTVASTAWPGLTTSSDLAFVAFNQQVHAVQIADGKQAWAFPATANASVTGLFFADPGIGPDMLVVGSEGPTGSYSGVLFGLNPQTGQQQWCLAFDKKGAQRQSCPLAQGASEGGLFGIAAPTDNRVIGGITLADGSAYLGLANGRMYAVEAASGKAQWVASAEHAVWAAPLVAGDTVYFASLDHSLYALNRSDGAVNWKKDLGAALADAPVLAEGTLYLGTFGNSVIALDAATGDEKWSAAASNWVWGSPMVVGGVVYFTDIGGTVYAVDAATGTQQWAVTPGGGMSGSPAVTADAVYVGDKMGKLFALDPASGATRWTATVGGELLGTPIVANDSILLAPYKGDNLLTAYTTAGALAWAFAPTK